MSLVNAEVKPSEKTYQLKSVDGGWVTIKRFDHGEMVDRLGKILVMGFNKQAMEEADRGEGRMDHRAARIHDFGKAITDHNLGDKEGKKLNFKNPPDVFKLDPSVGDEINELIGEHQDAIPDKEIPNSEGS